MLATKKLAKLAGKFKTDLIVDDSSIVFSGLARQWASQVMWKILDPNFTEFREPHNASC